MSTPRWKEHLTVCLALALVAGVTAAVRFDPAAAVTVEGPSPVEAAPPRPVALRREAPDRTRPPGGRPRQAARESIEGPAPRRPLAPPAGLHARLALPPLHEVSAPPDEPLEARLSELNAGPTELLGRRVRFIVQKDAVEARWSSYLSRFTPAAFMALRAWPDEVFTWYEPVYSDPARRLFARRGSRAAAKLREAERFSRLELVGVVREVFGGEPWIEIERVSPLPGMVGEGTLLAVERAIELLRQGSVAMALDQLERARAAPLPAHALAELARLEEAAREVLAHAETSGS